MSDTSRTLFPPASSSEIQVTLSAVFREEAGKVVGALLRILGNFEIAEEIVQDALLVALERWPVEGIPTQPGAWLLTVARRRAIDHLRRDARYRDKLAALEHPVLQEPDDRLRLMFTCCHPALSRETQVILMLRAVCGFTIAEIAHAFLTSEAAVARRLVRARQKIVQAGTNPIIEPMATRIPMVRNACASCKKRCRSFLPCGPRKRPPLKGNITRFGVRSISPKGCSNLTSR